MNKFLSTIAGAAMALGFVGTANAAVLTINFNDADVSYDGTTVCDATSCDGGNQISGEADAVSNIVFKLDGATVGTVSDGYFDLDVDVGSIDDGGDSGSFTSTGIFDLFDVDGYVLLDLGGGDGNFSYVDNNLFATFSFDAPADVFEQDLPFNLLFTDIDSILVTLSTSVVSSTDDGEFVTSFEATGNGTIAGIGEQLPEPAALGFLGLGLVGLGFARRRKQRAA